MPMTKHSHGGWGGSDESRPLRTPQDKGPLFPRRGIRGLSLPNILPRQTPGSPGPGQTPKKRKKAERDHAE
jgi:hypothetical protein